MLRIGVIGAGRLGSFHAQKLANFPYVVLAGVAEPVESRRTALAAAHGCPVWPDYRPLLDKCDAVIVATPATSHAGIVRECLLKGRHVFVEKPLATQADHAAELANLARKLGLTLQVGHIERFNPAFQAALPHIRDPWMIEAVRQGPFSFRCTDIGCILDLMIHDLDLIRLLVPSPLAAVSATAIAVLGPYEDAAQAQLVFTNGVSAFLKASRLEKRAARFIRIWTASSIVEVDFASRKTTVCRFGEQLIAGRLDITSLSSEELEELKETFEPQYLDYSELPVASCDPLEEELRDFVEAVRTGRPPQVTGESGQRAVELAETILESLTLHKISEKAPTFPLHVSRRAA